MVRLTSVYLVEVALACALARLTLSRRFLIQGRRFATFHTSLADLVQFAYGLHPRQIANGPAWLTSAK